MSFKWWADDEFDRGDRKAISKLAVRYALAIASIIATALAPPFIAAWRNNVFESQESADSEVRYNELSGGDLPPLDIEAKWGAQRPIPLGSPRWIDETNAAIWQALQQDDPATYMAGNETKSVFKTILEKYQPAEIAGLWQQLIRQDNDVISYSDQAAFTSGLRNAWANDFPKLMQENFKTADPGRLTGFINNFLPLPETHTIPIDDVISIRGQIVGYAIASILQNPRATKSQLSLAYMTESQLRDEIDPRTDTYEQSITDTYSVDYEDGSAIVKGTRPDGTRISRHLYTVLPMHAAAVGMDPVGLHAGR
jgi:hypothetical protein